MPRLLIATLLGLVALLGPAVVMADPDAGAIQVFASSNPSWNPNGGSANCGPNVVTWNRSGRDDLSATGTGTIEVTDSAGNVQFQVSQQVIGMEGLSPAWCGDLIGDGSQVLGYQSFSGGAHCCFSESVVLLDGSRRHLLDGDYGSGGLEPPQQIDGSGPLEIPGRIVFGYFNGLAFAQSPWEPIVYAYDGTQYVESTRKFHDFLAQDLSKREADIAAQRSAQPQDQEGEALTLYGLHWLLGDADQALPTIKARLSPVAAAWVDANLGDFRTALANAYNGGGGPSAAAASDTTTPAAPAPDPAAAPAPDAAAGDSGSTGLPDKLTDSARNDILTAVNKANSAWANATATLDGSALNGQVGGQELNDDLAELNKMRSQGQSRRNINTAFTVTDVTIDAPGHAVVRTHETWYAEIYSTRNGQMLQRTPATTYDESYVVEFQDGAWIVTKNNL